MTDKIHPSWNEYPNLLAELNPDGNKGFTHLGKPVSVLELAAGTNKKLEWICNTCEHEWITGGNLRISGGTGCPVCSGNSLHSDGRNTMAQTHPDLAAEYQGDATKFIAGTNQKLDWKCRTCDHEWKTSGSHRVGGQGCPACSNKAIHSDGRNSMAVTHPELAVEANGFDPTKFISGTQKKLDWKCRTCNHEWKTTGQNRLRIENGGGCPACSNRAINNYDGRNSMAVVYPELAIEYQGDATKIVAGAAKKLDWKCRICDHEWKAAAFSRAYGRGCPCCSGREAHIDGRNSMAITHPEVAVEANGFDPTKFLANTNKRLPWKCRTCDYEWITKGNHRIHQKSGCPACATFGFKPNEPAHYYVHKITSELGNLLYYKAGISKGWQRRLSQLRSGLPVHLTIENCEVIPFEVGQDALNLETTLLRMAAEEGWKAPAQPFDGGHELFTQNPLEIAREKQLVK